jgi:hypothetical protein
MSELRRLVDEETDELLLRVLRSAEDDAPAAGQRERAMAALGLGAPAVGVTAKILGAGVWKWAVAALVASAVGGAALSLSVANKPAPAAPPVPAAHTVAASPVLTSPVPAVLAPTAQDALGRPSAPAPESASSAIAEPSSVTRSADSVRQASQASQTVPSRTKPGLGVELAALDEARTALASGDPARALLRLDRYQREFPTPVLAQEATMLRIEALQAKGDTGAARALATRFLATHPSTTYEDRVRTLLGPSDSER